MITLILLAVITFMTVAFLVLSQRERRAVTVLTDQTVARFAVDAGRERGIAEMLGPILARTNDQLTVMLVSTNFINILGFENVLAPGANRYTNVNFEYTSLAPYPPLSVDQRLRNLQNLLYDPRVPVYRTNRMITNGLEFPFFHDLNRNFRFEQTGWQAVRNPLGGYYGTNGNYVALPIPPGTVLLSNFFVGDPQWIGILEYPDRPHSPSNRFVARYCFMVVPASQTLDVNYIYNFARRLPSPNQQVLMPNGLDSFARNQGVGTYEINLAALLTDLNTNLWPPPGSLAPNPYLYMDQNFANPNLGTAFEDALALLRYRYAGNFNNLVAPILATINEDNPNIDEYANGSAAGGGAPMDGTSWVDDRGNDWGTGFPGADNPNHLFTIEQFFDPTRSSADFTNHLRTASAGLSTYDSTTFYRMSEVLGTDSAPEPKLNVNYVNIDALGQIVPGMETNMIPWQPAHFFTNAADRMLRAQFRTISLTNIPVYNVTNGLNISSAVHRLTQLAANIYEATTNGFYPTMYRPCLSSLGSGPTASIIINGFEQVDTVDNNFLSPPLDITDPSARTGIPVYPASTRGMVSNNWYGIPWVIGARKGFPNFNELAAQSFFQVTRRLQILRNSTDPVAAPLSSYRIQQEFLMGISNVFGIELWNSYRTNFNVPVEIDVTGDMMYSLTNSDGFQVANRVAFTPIGTNVNAWPGTGPDKVPLPQSFVVPMRTNFVIVPTIAYRHSPPGFFGNTNTAAFEPVFSPPVVWGLSITNHVRVLIRERSTGRVLDYVQLSGPGAYRNLSEEIRTPNSAQYFTGLWSTNLTTTGVPQGVQNQIDISWGNGPVTADWGSYGINQATGPTRDWEIDNFRAFYHLGPIHGNNINNTNLIQQVPFTPTRIASVDVSWQANDPLVHYTADDLTDPTLVGTVNYPSPAGVITNLANIGAVNNRYNPWGGSPLTGVAPVNGYNMALKDPGVWSSDDWDFVTNRFPNIGWLGRVHRGTPWQTVYLKSTDITENPTNLKTWRNWCGSTNDFTARAMAPAADRLIFDLFTTAINENSVRGQLSINQPNLAAWSAVLSGVIVLTNTATDAQVSHTPPAAQYEPRVIDPAGIYGPNVVSPVAQIVEAINATRSNGRLFPDKVFTHLGDILAVTNLTETSPFLNISTVRQMQRGISDEVYERIPQQILGLLTLTHTPRFVIYAYGQTLRPAEGHSVVTGGPYSGLCTNYQITAEAATRTVVRVEGSLDPRDRNDPDPARRYPPRVVFEQFNPLPPD